jgi:AmpD protein
MQASGSIAAPLSIDAETGWISDARRVESPNSDERPGPALPELIVVHGISLPPGEFGGGFIDALFTNALPSMQHPYFEEIAHLRVSAHALISRDGQLTQYVSFLRRAWHCGESDFCGRQCCNDFSVGIELEGADDVPYEDVQYVMLAELLSALRSTWPSLRDAAIVGHSDISPGRKTDPGPAFDWPRLHGLLGLEELI